MTAATIEHDEVNAPAHYFGADGIEVIDVIEAYGLAESFHLANFLKYALRAGAKGNAKQDLEKGRWYIQRFAGEDPEEFVFDWPTADELAPEMFPINDVVEAFGLTGARAAAVRDFLSICLADDTDRFDQFVENLQQAIAEAA